MQPCPVLVVKLDPVRLERAKKKIKETLQIYLQGPLEHHQTYSKRSRSIATTITYTFGEANSDSYSLRQVSHSSVHFAASHVNITISVYNLQLRNITQ